MKVLTRTKDFRLLATEALLRRVHPAVRNNRQLQKELSIRMAGYYGERQVDYMLRTYPLTNAFALSDIRLTHENHDFQIDTLILTPQGCLILETKNWAGELEYDPNLQQLVQLHQGQKSRYRCPLAQVEVQKRNLTGWLLAHGFPAVPIETFVVIGNSSTILSNPQQDQLFTQKVFHADLLHEKLNTIFTQLERKPLSLSMIHRLKEELITRKTTQVEEIITKLHLSEAQLVPGVVCEKCWQHTMRKRGHTWHCEQCHHRDKKAHEQAIYDYFLLHEMKPLTNSALRQFLNEPSRHVIYALLQSMKLTMTRSKRHALYHAPPLDQFPQQATVPVL